MVKGGRLVQINFNKKIGFNQSLNLKKPHQFNWAYKVCFRVFNINKNQLQKENPKEKRRKVDSDSDVDREISDLWYK